MSDAAWTLQTLTCCVQGRRIRHRWNREQFSWGQSERDVARVESLDMKIGKTTTAHSMRRAASILEIECSRQDDAYVLSYVNDCLGAYVLSTSSSGCSHILQRSNIIPTCNRWMLMLRCMRENSALSSLYYPWCSRPMQYCTIPISGMQHDMLRVQGPGYLLINHTLEYDVHACLSLLFNLTCGAAQGKESNMTSGSRKDVQQQH
jgi:hypothetical protein